MSKRDKLNHHQRKFKNRNKYAKSLELPEFRQKIVPEEKVYSRKGKKNWKIVEEDSDY